MVEVPALGRVAAELAQHGELGVVLDPLRDGSEPEVACEVEDRAHHEGVLRIAPEPVHERPVHLERRRRIAAQLAQRRVPGAEVVDRDRHAQVEQLVDGPARGVVDHHVLGYLDGQLLGVEPVAAERVVHPPHRTGAGQLAGRHVHRDL